MTLKISTQRLKTQKNGIKLASIPPPMQFTYSSIDKSGRGKIWYTLRPTLIQYYNKPIIGNIAKDNILSGSRRQRRKAERIVISFAFAYLLP